MFEVFGTFLESGFSESLIKGADLAPHVGSLILSTSTDEPCDPHESPP